MQLRGTKGKLSKQQLTRKAHEDGLAALSSNPSPFKFLPGSTENFNIRAPDIGDLIALEVEVSNQEICSSLPEKIGRILPKI